MNTKLSDRSGCSTVHITVSQKKSRKNLLITDIDFILRPSKVKYVHFVILTCENS